MFRKDHNHHSSEKKIIHLNACCNVIAIHKLKTDLKLGKLQLRMVWLVVFILHHATKEPRPLQVKNSWRKRETSGLCSRAFNATPVVCLRTNVPQSSTEKWFVKCREFQACLGSDSLTVSLFQMLGIWTGVPRSYALQHDMTDQFWPAGLAEKEVWSNAKCQENHGCRGMKRWMQGNLRGNNLKMETSKIWSQESLQEARMRPRVNKLGDGCSMSLLQHKIYLLGGLSHAIRVWCLWLHLPPKYILFNHLNAMHVFCR